MPEVSTKYTILVYLAGAYIGRFPGCPGTSKTNSIMGTENFLIQSQTHSASACSACLESACRSEDASTVTDYYCN